MNRAGLPRLLFPRSRSILYGQSLSQVEGLPSPPSRRVNLRGFPRAALVDG